ncbi:MAG: TolC family protein, partial [Rickettsiales bacterium]
MSCTVLAGLLSAPVQAQEPHDPSAHDYADSVYQSGPVLTLPEAMVRAIQASPRLKSVAAGFEAAKGAEDQAGYWPNPELEFEAENIAGSGPFSGTGAAEYTYGLSQKVEIGGKRMARQQAAEAVREAAAVRLQAERLNLERDVHI